MGSYVQGTSRSGGHTSENIRKERDVDYKSINNVYSLVGPVVQKKTGDKYDIFLRIITAISPANFFFNLKIDQLTHPNSESLNSSLFDQKHSASNSCFDNFF
jgi:hypothetical protein